MKMEWNSSGWFGSQLGGTAWILVAAILSSVQELSTGLLLLAVFAIPNVVGLVLWRRRSLSCYAATQLLLAIMGLCGLLAIYLLERSNDWERIQTGASISASSAYFIVAAVIGILMITFYFRFGRATKTRN